MPAAKMLDLSRREIELKEYLESPQISDEDIDETFRLIRLVNSYGGGYAVIRRAFAGLLRLWPKGRPVEILDAGCGPGDTGADILKWGKAKGLIIKYRGIDINEKIIRIAKERTEDRNLEYEVCDIFDPNLPEADFIILSMVLHHFNDEEILTVLERLLTKARHGIIINDLERSYISYFVCYIVTCFFKKRLWRADPLISIRRGFKKDEFKVLLARLGVDGTIKKRFAGRISVIIKR